MSSERRRSGQVLTAPPDDAPKGFADHTPIIVTGGSASIQHAEGEYSSTAAEPDVLTSAGLFLDEVQLFGLTHANGDDICHTLAQGEQCIIEVTCKRGGQPDRNFTITGGKSQSPQIRFSHAEYRQGADFPPTGGISTNVRFGRRDRTITRLQIFRVQAGGNVLVHDCPVIAASGGISQFIVWDRHQH